MEDVPVKLVVQEDKGSGTAKPRVKAPVAVALGWLMVVGGSIYRIPQILKIHRARSAEGINLTSALLSSATTCFTFAHSSNAGYPFNTYGESIPQFATQVVIILQTLRYSKGYSTSKLIQHLFAHLLFLGAASRAKMLLGSTVGSASLTAMQASTPVLEVIEKLPQLVQTWRIRSTGEISVVTVLLAFTGKIIRLYTSLRQLRHDPLAFAPFAIGTILTGTQLGQLLAYGNRRAIVSG